MSVESHLPDRICRAISLIQLDDLDSAKKELCFLKLEHCAETVQWWNQFIKPNLLFRYEHVKAIWLEAGLDLPSETPESPVG